MRSCNTFNTQSIPLIRQVQPEVKRQRKRKPGRASSARKSRPKLLLITKGLYLKTGLSSGDRWLLMFQHRHRRYRKVIGDAGVISQAEAEIIARDVIRAVRPGKQDRPILPQEKTFRAAVYTFANERSVVDIAPTRGMPPQPDDDETPFSVAG